ncbi:hypothetical protein ASD11_16755 [Aeromicrobium sp. Root495]|uniref:hypothetical protein n=1 Tax=Aeromicrobium sp. Root495 TaxID=1736550 RepID=UPI0006F31867|nr:hypothetical protein [Aeromicrobium sp. Root495]KQY56113.1 hypothetical protein ASD11_16755 [Aeromicrobium sp. Root495]
MKIKNAAIATAGLALAGVAVAGPALATGSSYTVAVGGSSAAGTHNITATSSGPLGFAVPTLTMGCTSAAVPASPVSTVASGTAITDIASINKINFTGCTGPGGALTVTTVGSWKLHATGAATSAATDVIAGHVDSITANVANAVCKFTVTGKANGTYNEGTKVLNVSETGFTGNLKVSNVVGCLGQVQNGQSANFTGSFNVVSPDGLINAS